MWSEVESLVDDRYGPFLDHKASRVQDLDWWIHHLRLAEPTFCAGRRVPFRTGASGCALEEEVARIRALGEALERSAALQHDPRRDCVDCRVDDPRSFFDRFPRCLPSEPAPRGCIERHFEDAIPHVPALRLSQPGRDVLVPAGFATLAHEPRGSEPRLTPGISTGLAYGRRLVDALLAGLAEVIERDALMTAWWTAQIARRVDVDDATAPWFLRERVERLRRAELRVDLYDISTELRLPTIACVLRGDHYPYAIVGAACKFDVAEACAKAIDEAVSVRWHEARRPPRELPSTMDFTWVRQLADHADLYAAWHDTHAFDPWDSVATTSLTEVRASKWRSRPSSMSELRAWSLELEAEGLDVLYIDLGPYQVHPVGATVKVIVPQLVPLCQDHRIRWLGSPRLQARLGDRDPTFSPHPFA